MNGIHHTVHHMGRKYLPTKLRGRSSVRIWLPVRTPGREPSRPSRKSARSDAPLPPTPHTCRSGRYPTAASWAWGHLVGDAVRQQRFGGHVAEPADVDAVAFATHRRCGLAAPPYAGHRTGELCPALVAQPLVIGSAHEAVLRLVFGARPATTPSGLLRGGRVRYQASQRDRAGQRSHRPRAWLWRASIVAASAASSNR